MSSPRRRSNSRTVQLLPFELHRAKGVDITRNDIFSSVTGRTSKEDDLGFTYLGDGVTEASQWHFSKGVDLLKLLCVSCHDISNNTSVVYESEYV